MLKVNEIYKSIQGESSFVGLPCVFIRLTGCPLRCVWCDTAYAFEEGKEMTVSEVVQSAKSLGLSLVELTGGEPLSQKDAFPLVKSLLGHGCQVLVETSGAVLVTELDPRAVKIMDIKCPGSGMMETMLWENLNHLTGQDELKFVIKDKNDFDWSCSIIEKHRLQDRKILFSPVFGELEPKLLSSWILEKNIAVRMQLQIHKYIWDPDARGV
ncbi:MAG: radical SAM protein [Chlamydiae bacterium]|nr:radical SAM protein [Chlamydiota bacterium]MBI3276838.1 radical SAM protein [Chlamydiota bacterium]